MKNSRLEKDKKNTIQHNLKCNEIFKVKKEIDHSPTKDITNLFRLKKEKDDTTEKDIRNLFRLQKIK